MKNKKHYGRYLVENDKLLQINAFFTMFECERAGGYTFQGETHDFWECVYVKEGEVCVSADERIYNLGKGEMIFHKPMEFHKFYVTKNSSAQLFIFTFTLSGSLCGFFENKVFSLDKTQIDMINSVIAFVHDKTQNEASEKDMFNYFLDILSRNDLHMQMLTNLIYRLFLSICDTNDTSFAESDADSARIYKSAVEYMNENLEKNLSVCDIAEHCCISTTGLKKIFSEYAGIGIHKFFLKLKMKKATTLLAGSSTTSEISHMLGFSSQGYFSEAFKRETGLSPKEYRKRCSQITHY